MNSRTEEFSQTSQKSFPSAHTPAPSPGPTPSVKEGEEERSSRVSGATAREGTQASVQGASVAQKASGCVRIRSLWLEPGWGAGLSHPPPPRGPGVSRLFPLMLPGQLENGRRVCPIVCSAVSSHIPWPGQDEVVGSSIRHLLPTSPPHPALGIGQRQSSTPGSWQGRKETQLSSHAPEPIG